MSSYWLSLKRLHPGEIEDVADRVRLCEDHDQAVDADADASSGRHALADRFDEFFIEWAGLFVAG